MTDPWLVVLAVASALFISGLVLWRRLSERRVPRPVEPRSAALEAWLRDPIMNEPQQTQERDLLRVVVILFGAESSALSRAAEAALGEAAQRLTDRPELTVTVEGSADSTGNPTRNLVLARDRAWAAREFLLGRGIASERIRSVVKTPTAGRTEYERQRLRCVRLTWEAT